MARGTMKLVDPHTGRMECRVCGATHVANVKGGTGGQFWRGAWQCPNRDAHGEVGTHAGARVGAGVERAG